MVGSAIANGRLLYRDITSQHMPVMYYIAAVFSLFGAKTIVCFRLCFYLFMAILWGIMYYRYAEHINGKVMALYPAIYIVLLTYIDMGHAVLSDQIQGIGIAMLLCELLIFERSRELKTGNMLMISLAVFLSFGSAFVAAFAIFFVVMTVVLLEVQRYRQLKMSFAKGAEQMMKSYWKLVAIVAAPLMALAIYYLATGTFDDFWGWAYRINREVYPKYLSYGTSILSSMFGGYRTIWHALRSPFVDFSARGIIYSLTTAAAICALIHIQKCRKNLILTLGIFLIWSGAATRGNFNYHGTPAMAVMCVLDAYILIQAIQVMHKKKLVLYIMVFLSSVFYLYPYLQIAYRCDMRLAIHGLKVDASSTSHIIDLITEDKEVIGLSTFDTQVIFESGTSPTKLFAACPWAWVLGC